jgi:LmbE family N-acetylglucosaminyl deacetylase
LIVISPHLDDAVFGCGSLIAARPGALVATLFAGTPPAPFPLTPWDADCGFDSTEQALVERKREDAAALGLLGALPRWLQFLDSQYRAACPAPEELRDAVLGLVVKCQPERCVFPMGLFHEDHRLAHEAALAALRHLPAVKTLVYEDALYRRIPGLVTQRLRQWRVANIAFRFAGERPPHPRKAAAVGCYASQLRGLSTPQRPGGADLAIPERYWTLRL